MPNEDVLKDAAAVELNIIAKSAFIIRNIDVFYLSLTLKTILKDVHTYFRSCQYNRI